MEEKKQPILRKHIDWFNSGLETNVDHSPKYDN